MLYIGLDVHSKHSTYEGINSETGEINSGYRIPNEELEERIGSLPGPKKVILEAGRTSWDWYRRLRAVADEVWIVCPQEVRRLLKGEAKTDRRDARALALLAIKGLIKPLWIPDEMCVQLRTLTRSRGRLIKQRTAAKNGLRALVAQYGKPCKYSSVTGAAARKFFDQLELPEVAMDMIAMSRELILMFDKKIKEVELRTVARLKEDPVWNLLQTIPGVATINASSFVAEIGTIERFANPDALVHYSGLDPSTVGSGDKLRHGPIPKRGNKYLRTAAVLAAQQQRSIKKKDSKLRRNYWRMIVGGNHHPNVAKVDTARKILKAVFYVWTKEEPYRDSIMNK